MDKAELLKLRKSMQITQAQMTELLRIPLATVQELEAGTLDMPTSRKLVRALIARDFWLSRRTDSRLRARKRSRGSGP
jgi:hypothetical protein